MNPWDVSPPYSPLSDDEEDDNSESDEKSEDTAIAGYVASDKGDCIAEGVDLNDDILW
jgi:hypothetical protein